MLEQDLKPLEFREAFLFVTIKELNKTFTAHYYKMKKYIYLSTCDTCRRILKELGLPAEVEMQDIKKDPITTDQLDWLFNKAGSYEALINNRARKFKELGLSPKDITEKQRKDLLLTDYTFLKRPVLIWNDEVFIGNAKKTIEEAKATINK